jgi:photosystem II stability/assembly factor-like uncharacterized protein
VSWLRQLWQAVILVCVGVWVPWLEAAEYPGFGMAPARFLPKEERLAAEGVEPQEPGQPVKLNGNSATEEPLDEDALRNDAALADVCFVDRQHGWAVGDRGTIWHTRDGGHRWVLQRSGVACRLQSVCFIDPKTGWAVGGELHPYVHTGSGVLLFTEDGGQHWNRHNKLLLPPLDRVRFFGPRSGVAIGLPSALLPSGLFYTEAGGRSWDPVPGVRPLGRQAGDFLDSRNGAVLDKSGAVSITRQGCLPSEQPLPPFDLRLPCRLELTAPNGGWAVGQGGLVWRTADLGATWHAPPGQLVSLGANAFDFAALAVRGPKCWIAGNPGTRVFFTPDAGLTWSAFPTGQNLPLEALWFVDDDHGWAVGALGTILATADGGRTWKVQRSGGARVALLGIFGEPKDIPWELFARLSGNDGYFAAAVSVFRRDAELPPRHEVPITDRIQEAAVRVGACAGLCAWQFPLRQSGLEMPAAQIVQAWDAIHDNRGLESLEAYLIQLIRTWRPEVLVTHDPARVETDAARLLAQAVLKAAASAAEADTDRVNPTGLAPWQVKRVVYALGPAAHGAMQVTSGQWADRLGRTLGEVGGKARGLLADQFRAAPQAMGFQVAFDLAAPDRRGRDFFSGLNIATGSDCRRLPPSGATASPDMLRRLAQRRQNAQAILQRQDDDPRGRAALVAEASDLAHSLDPASAVELLYQLAQSYHASGDWDWAAEVFETIAREYVDQPLSRPAQVWLIQYYASGEAKRRAAIGEQASVRQASALLGADRSELHRERAVALGTFLQQTRPDLLAQPSVGFPLAGIQRRAQPRLAERFYAAQRSGAVDPAWRQCAQLEQWLADPRGPAPKPLFRCRVAVSRPYLDGALDDAVWQAAEAVSLRSALGDDAAWPATARMAYDREFLYAAVEVRKAPGFRYEPASGPRRRDTDLTAHDRVEFFFDLDRDYATSYRLAVDARGFTRDDCWGDSSWNPTWFVAAASSNETWTAEIAIPLEQLTSEAPQKGTAWAIGIQRVVPGVGFQSFSFPAAIEAVPQGFGCLLFE